MGKKKMKRLTALIVSLGMMLSGLPVLAAELTDVFTPITWASIATHNYLASGTKVLDLSGLPGGPTTSGSGMTTITIPANVEDFTIVGASDKTFTGLNIVAAIPRTDPLKLTIKNLKLEASVEGINITQGSGNVTLNLVGDNNIKSTASTAIGVRDGKSLIITANDLSGKLTAQGGGGASAIGGAKDQAVGNIEITGGTITAVGSGEGAGIGGPEALGGVKSVGNITITGGAITATGGTSGGAGIGAGYTTFVNSIKISGGTIQANGGVGGAGIGGARKGTVGPITISGGNITAEGTGKGAGIGAGDDEGNVGAIVVSSGTITALGGLTGGAGIGGGNNGFSTSITISGGTITKALGGAGAAGIGAGASGSSGPIVIQGSNTTIVEAVGGNGGGAGIGGGDIATGTNSTVDITINGANITKVQGGTLAAGIGGGNNRGLGTITIINANIGTVQGGAGGAGIGTGREGEDNGTISITGGKIVSIKGGGDLNASSPGSGGAAIGGGHSRGASTITIGGGAIIELAQGGPGAAGIGSAQNGQSGDISISGKSSIYALAGSTGVNDIGGGKQRETHGDVQITESYVFLGNGIVTQLSTGNPLAHFTFYKQESPSVRALLKNKDAILKCVDDTNLIHQYDTKEAGVAIVILNEHDAASGYYFQLRIGNEVWDTRRETGLIPIQVAATKTAKNGILFDVVMDIDFGLLYSIPTAGFEIPPANENIVVPYSTSNISYRLDLTDVKSLTDVKVTGIVTSIDLKKTPNEYVDFNLSHPTQPIQVIVYKYNPILDSYVYDATLSSGFTINKDLVAKTMTITYPASMHHLAVKKFQVNIVVPTVLNLSVDGNTTKVSNYLAQHVTTTEPLNQFKKVDTVTEIKAEVKIRDPLNTANILAIESVPISDISQSIDLRYKDLVKIK